jgi:cytochrome c-type biogenesis protein CcmH/NrfG
VLGRYDAASMAYNEASKRLPPNASLYVEWAEAIAQAQGRSLAGTTYRPSRARDQARTRTT